MEVFEHPQCSASLDATPTPTMSVTPPINSQTHYSPPLPVVRARPPHNHAAVVFFGSVVTLPVAVLVYVWYRGYRAKLKERRRIRATLERIKAKQAAHGQGRVSRTVAVLSALRQYVGSILAVLASRGVDKHGPIPSHQESELVQQSVTFADDAKSKTKRVKEKVKRIKTRSTVSTHATSSKVHKPLTVSDDDADKPSAITPPPSSISTAASTFVTDANGLTESPEGTDTSLELPKTLEERPLSSPSPSTSPSTTSTSLTSMVSIVTPDDVDNTPCIPESATLKSLQDLSTPASPKKNLPITPVFLSFCPSPTPSHSSCGSLSHGRPSRSASLSSITASSTAAPVTPPPRSISLPLKYDLPESWDSEHVSSDSAWDWDGQRPLYNIRKSAHPVQRLATDPACPSLLTSELPAVVFPSLNQPSSSPTEENPSSSEIQSLKAAIKTSRQREMKHRREAEELAKQRDFATWRLQQVQEGFHRREGELQAEITHLRVQLHGLALPSPQFIPPPQFLPGQQHFPLYYPLPTSPYLHPSPFSHAYPSPQSSAGNEMGVSEKLAEAILKRPESIRSSISGSTSNEGHDDTFSLSQSQGSGEASPIHHDSPCSSAVELNNS